MKTLELLEKFKQSLDFHVIPESHNPNMPEFEGRHFKVYIKNKETNKEESFIYSMGLGIERTDEESVIIGLMGAFLSDMPYTDLNEFDDLGYKGKEAVKLYNAVCEQEKKLKTIGLYEYLNDLPENEKEIL